MTATSAPPMASFTLKEINSLDPVENLPAMQHTKEGSSTTSRRPTAAQQPMLKDYSELTKLNSDVLDVKAESEQELGPNVSDSEDEHDDASRPLNISERRKVQNNKFSAWCVPAEEMAQYGVEAHRIKQVIQARSQDHE